MATSPILNGNTLVKEEHVFVPGDGCFFTSRETARRVGVGPNAAGEWLKELSAFGRVWFQAGQTNAFD